MYSTILFPTDGSETTDALVDHVAALADWQDATVHVLYVVDDRAFLTLSDDLVGDVAAELDAEGREVTDTAAALLRQAGVDVVADVRTGSPSDEILGYVEENGVDLVMMGTRGADFRRNMLGSAAQRVVTAAPVPVMTVALDHVSSDETPSVESIAGR
ncbi:Nucleotide-binding universal stress protein, UspA family [Halogranum amylolyticum]|uniref:Nucleotide-binding universal stress protein, UspA family n=1 Tax=Halogranum amylolyticum TaxID=660520 RepID=A0A1H8N2P3_9EURY|nr:universal stress protein [Halogranum amylolyticum]SEO23728.1 Nucleotide-binding universal stress protein, UspA family [Halogranum amylolyticum]